MARAPKNNFNFEISLSVLNHLGRNLYRNSITSWAKPFRIHGTRMPRMFGSALIETMDRSASKTTALAWMAKSTFRQTFLEKSGIPSAPTDECKHRANALSSAQKVSESWRSCSCAKRITIFSKKKGRNYIGGTIDNSGLDKAITHDLRQISILLKRQIRSCSTHCRRITNPEPSSFSKALKNSIKSSIDHVRKMLAL